MKKILGLLVSVGVLFSFGLAYTPTNSDQALLEKLHQRIEIMFSSKPQSISSLVETLDAIKHRYQGRSAYIIKELIGYSNDLLGVTNHTEELVVTVISVIDGDTFKVYDREKEFSVRLIGINAPERNTAEGKLVKDSIESVFTQQQFRLEYDPSQSKQDIYGRDLAYVFDGEKNMNLWLIAQGYAKEYTYRTDYTYKASFVEAEREAQQAKLGIWSDKFVQEVASETMESGSCPTCSSMTCEQAYEYLPMCPRLDGNSDGVPCEAVCSR